MKVKTASFFERKKQRSNKKLWSCSVQIQSAETEKTITEQFRLQ